MANEINETAFQAKYDEVERLCNTATDGDGGTATTLGDWMREGNWDTMDAQDIAAEWDALSDN